MSDKWLVNEDYPNGHLVPMTPAEEAQLGKDRAAGAAIAAAQAETAAKAAARIARLQKARTDLAGGVIFASLSARERSTIDMLLAGVVGG